jgi:hypothetical protein
MARAYPMPLRTRRSGILKDKAKMLKVGWELSLVMA